MSLPENILSSSVVSANFIGGRANTITDILDYETGGVNIEDASQGKQVQIWTGKLVGNDITLESPLTEPVVVYSGENITEFSFTFDQLMHPVIAFVQDGIAKLYWYDSSEAAYVVTAIAAGAVTPKVSLDDKRTSQDGTSDVIVAYMSSSDDLYIQRQRDRYEISYKLASCIFGTLNKIGMTDKLRFMFYFTEFTPFNSAGLDNPYTSCMEEPNNCGTLAPDDPYNISSL